MIKPQQYRCFPPSQHNALCMCTRLIVWYGPYFAKQVTMGKSLHYSIWNTVICYMDLCVRFASNVWTICRVLAIQHEVLSTGILFVIVHHCWPARETTCVEGHCAREPRGEFLLLILNMYFITHNYTHLHVCTDKHTRTCKSNYVADTVSTVHVCRN